MIKNTILYLLLYHKEHLHNYFKYVLLVHGGTLIEIHVSEFVTKMLRLSSCIPLAVRSYIIATESGKQFSARLENVKKILYTKRSL